MVETPSQSGTTIVAGGAISNGLIWGIDSQGQVETVPYGSPGPETVDTGTAHVLLLAVVNGVIWQMNSSGLWWAKTGGPGAYDGWTSGPGTDNSSGTRTSPLAGLPSVSGAVFTYPDGTNPLVDPQGNVWWINASGQVVENGVVDKLTSNVIEMAYVNGVVWQENSADQWWAKTGGPGAYDGWTSGPGTDNANGTVVAPVPVDRNWIGGGDNSASEPQDWNPGSVPIANDTLAMASGTMNISGNALQGNYLIVGDAAADTITLNVSGSSTFAIIPQFGTSAFYDTNLTVNLASGSVWNGYFTAYPGSNVLIEGRGTFNNIEFSGADGFSGSSDHVVIDANVIGNGNFEVGGAGRMEFMKSVASGQTIYVEGYNGLAGILQIDHPSAFAASVQLGFGETILEGVTATSYSFANDVLSLFNGTRIVESLSFSVPGINSGNAGEDLGVSQLGGAIDIHGDGTSYTAGGTLLPVHA